VIRKELWLFLAKLVPLTLLLGYVWFRTVQRQYPDFVDVVADPFFRLVGVRRWWLALVIEHFTNIVPYLALVLASPDLIARWRRTLAALLGGGTALVLGHLLLSTAVYHLNEAYGLSKSFYRVIVPLYLVNDALPLILWFAFYPSLPGRLLGIRLFSARDRNTAG